MGGKGVRTGAEVCASCKPGRTRRTRRLAKPLMGHITRKSACLVEARIPPTCAQGFVQFAKQILSADFYTGLQIRWTNNRQRRLGHDQFAPEGIPAPEIRRRVRLAQ